MDRFACLQGISVNINEGDQFKWTPIFTLKIFRRVFALRIVHRKDSPLPEADEKELCNFITDFLPDQSLKRIFLHPYIFTKRLLALVRIGMQRLDDGSWTRRTQYGGICVPSGWFQATYILPFNNTLPFV